MEASELKRNLECDDTSNARREPERKTLRLWNMPECVQRQWEESIEIPSFTKIVPLDGDSYGGFLLLSEKGKLHTWYRDSKDEPKILERFSEDNIIDVVSDISVGLSWSPWHKVAILNAKGEVYLFRINAAKDKIETTDPHLLTIPIANDPIIQVAFGLLNDLIAITTLGSVYIWDVSNSIKNELANPRRLTEISSKNAKAVHICSSHSIISVTTKGGEVYSWRKLWYRTSWGKIKEYYGVEKLNRSLNGIKVKQVVYQNDQIIVCTEDGNVFSKQKNVSSLNLIRGLEDKNIIQITSNGNHVLALTSSGYLFEWDTTSRPKLLQALEDENVIDACIGGASSHPIIAIVTDSTPSSTRTYLDKRSLLNKQDQCDVVFIVETQQIHVKAAILVARSEYFRAMFESNMKESREGVVKVPFFSKELFYLMLEYLHTDVYCLDDMDVEVLMALYEIADMYQLEGLVSLCMTTFENYLIDLNMDESFKNVFHKIEEYGTVCNGLMNIFYDVVERKNFKVDLVKA